MGKNSFQAAKAARYASSDAAGDGDQEFRPFSDGMADVTYHTPAWHQARIEALMRPRLSYEDWKIQAKEAEGKLAAAADEEEARMREYRRQLDADRAARMGKAAGAVADGKDKSSKDKKKRKKSSKDKKHKKDKHKKRSKHKKSSSKHKKRSSKDKDSGRDKKRRRSSSSSSSGSSSDSDSSGSSSDSGSSSGSEDEAAAKKRKRGEDEPVRLSEFLRG